VRAAVAVPAEVFDVRCAEEVDRRQGTNVAQVVRSEARIAA
jgi:hypothetical protein